jgi:hypothetical protein
MWQVLNLKAASNRAMVGRRDFRRGAERIFVGNTFLAPSWYSPPLAASCTLSLSAKAKIAHLEFIGSDARLVNQTIFLAPVPTSVKAGTGDKTN